MQHVAFMFNAASAQSWEDAFKAGRTNEIQSKFFLPKSVEELYDTENDPWEINNLSGDPAYKDVLVRMRGVLTGWMEEIRDVGLIPETDYDIYSGGKSMYEYMHNSACPFDILLKASELAILGSKKDLKTFIGYLKNDNIGVRYWGITGLLILKSDSKSAIPELKKLANDKSSAVRTLTAETLYGLGEKETAWKIYVSLLQNTVDFDRNDRNFALNSIDVINDNNPEIISIIRKMYEDNKSKLVGFAKYSQYDLSMCEYLLKKWGVI
jgi:hypothetical protein